MLSLPSPYTPPPQDQTAEMILRGIGLAIIVFFGVSGLVAWLDKLTAP